MARLMTVTAVILLQHCDDRTPGSRPPTATETVRALESIERLIDAGKTSEALLAAESLQRSLPESSMAAEMLGRARMAAKADPLLIAQAYALAADLSPQSPGLQSVAGITAAAARQWRQSEERHHTAELLQPGHPQHALHRSISLRALGALPESLAAADRACALAPLDATVQLNRAQALLAMGSKPQACDGAMATLSLKSNDAALRLAVTDFLIEAGDPDRAIRVIMVDASQPDAPAAVLESLARAQSSAGKPADAAETWKRVAVAPLAGWQPCLRAAENALKAGDLTESKAWLNRAKERGAPTSQTQSIEQSMHSVPSTQ